MKKTDNVKYEVSEDCVGSFFFKLTGIETEIVATCRHKFAVASLFDNLAVAHDDNDIGIAYG